MKRIIILSLIVAIICFSSCATKKKSKKEKRFESTMDKVINMEKTDQYYDSGGGGDMLEK